MSAPARPRLFIDGYNLALDQGTGVATYARNLSFALGRLGFGVGVLYGTRPTLSADPLIREIAFFDERVGEAPQWVEVLRRAHRMVTQGSRMSLVGDDLEHVVVVPGGPLAPAT